MAREPISVLRVKRTDVKDAIAVVLIYSTGRNALDLEFVASEGENAWGATVKESKIGDFKAANYDGSNEAWTEALQAGLLLTSPNHAFASELEGLEVVSTIAKGKSKDKVGDMSLVFRRSIGELTQRLGTIELKETVADDDFLWDGLAAGAKLNAEARQHVNDLDAKLAEQIENNRKLQEQLKELIAAKEESEIQMLQKFTELLNAKKSKIRDQQRVLATAMVDEDKVARAIRAQSPAKSTTSRTNKRKVATEAASEDESSDGFESVDEDQRMKDNATPEPLEDGNDATTDEDSEDEPPPPKKGIKKALGSRAKKASPPPKRAAASQSQSSRTLGRSQASQKDVIENDEEDMELPPRRELPFARRKAAQDADAKMSQDAAPVSQAKSASSAMQSSPAGGDDDDTTDDEL